MYNHPTSLGKRERQGAPSHCPPDSVPLTPRQGRSPAPPFPIIFGVFALISSAFQQRPQRGQPGQAETEPARNELVRTGQQEDTPTQRCDEHEEPGEATHTGRCVITSPALEAAQA